MSVEAGPGMRSAVLIASGMAGALVLQVVVMVMVMVEPTAAMKPAWQRSGRRRRVHGLPGQPVPVDCRRERDVGCQHLHPNLSQRLQAVTGLLNV